MKMDIFCEIQASKPWRDNHEHVLFRETLEQARAADENGFDIWWQVEHHGAPEFSYSSAPELVLTAIAQQTRRLRVGHAGVLAPFRINHPLKVAERGATLDHLSGGRFELGLAKSGGKEWETFRVDPTTARDELREAMEMIPRMWGEAPFQWDSELISVPEREVLPKPLQKPHPRLWQTAGSPESFRMAGELGVGVLGTTLLSPVDFMKQLLDEYQQGLDASAGNASPYRRRTEERGVFTFVHVAESRADAIRNGAAYAALWYVHAAPIIFKVPRSVWYNAIRSGLHPNSPEMTAALNDADQTSLEISPDEVPVIKLLKRLARGDEVSHEEAHEVCEEMDSVIIGDVDHCRAKMRKYQSIGCDRLMCLMQIGHIPNEAVIESIRLCGRHLVGRF
jgi:alkanesulfonate monooxygenase SsuD/methylene tetrahydromethanopterin reductase-like flavin-dependent oxidoreductase (luciferase family)